MKFTKLQATGNDFVVIDARGIEVDWAKLARLMCERRLGIGADGLIMVLNSKVADVKMRIFNADGSEAEICGNGIRCLAKYILDRRLLQRYPITVETLAGIRKVDVSMEEGKVYQATVSMGQPKFGPDDIPVGAGIQQQGPVLAILDYRLEVSGQVLPVSLVSMGNSHAVFFSAESPERFPLTVLGPQIEHHTIFPKRTNFEVAHVVNQQRIEVRVWERGAGETLSCGSGACAVAVAARLKGLVADKIEIVLSGGALTVEWDGHGEVMLSGPVEEVFEGEWNR